MHFWIIKNRFEPRPFDVERNILGLQFLFCRRFYWKLNFFSQINFLNFHWTMRKHTTEDALTENFILSSADGWIKNNWTFQAFFDIILFKKFLPNLLWTLSPKNQKKNLSRIILFTLQSVCQGKQIFYNRHLQNKNNSFLCKTPMFGKQIKHRFLTVIAFSKFFLRNLFTMFWLHLSRFE